MTLPGRITPITGQPLDCYLEHVADSNGLTTAELLNLIRIRSAEPARYLTLSPGSATLQAIHALTGTPIQELHTMTLAGLGHNDGWGLDDFNPSHPGAFQRIPNRGWLKPRTSQLCPACLAATGHWQLGWRLQTSTCCTIHHNYLATGCPTCGRPFRDQASTPLRPAGIAPICGAATASGRAARCHQVLTTILTGAAADDELDRQNRHDRAIGGQPITVLGDSVTGSQYLADSRNLAVLLLHLARQPATGSVATLPTWTADVAAVGKQPWGKVPPDSAVVRSAVLTEADRILTAADRDQAAVRFAGWIERVPRRNEGTVAWLADRTHLTPTLYGIVNSAQNPRRRLSHRLDHEPPLIDDARYIPQQIPEELYQELFADTLQLRADVGRTFISLCLGRSLSTITTWTAAAHSLGLSPDFGHRLPALASAGLLPSISELIARISAASERLARVDYRACETYVRNLSTTYPWFLGWCRTHRPGSRPSSQRYAVTWLWEHVAHAHLLTSPAAMTTPKARAGYRQFAAGLNRDQRLALSRAGSEVGVRLEDGAEIRSAVMAIDMGNRDSGLPGC